MSATDENPRESESAPVPVPVPAPGMGAPHLAPRRPVARSEKVPGMALGWTLFWLSIPGNAFASLISLYVGPLAPGYFLVPVALAALGLVTLAKLSKGSPSIGLGALLILISLIAPVVALSSGG